MCKILIRIKKERLLSKKRSPLPQGSPTPDLWPGGGPWAFLNWATDMDLCPPACMHDGHVTLAGGHVTFVDGCVTLAGWTCCARIWACCMSMARPPTECAPHNQTAVQKELRTAALPDQSSMMIQVKFSKLGKEHIKLI